MSLPPNGRLDHYEIIVRMGAGGMGEVYRARDTRLGRELAIKVLPQEIAALRPNAFGGRHFEPAPLAELYAGVELRLR